MRIRDSDIDQLARYLVEGLIRREAIKPKTDVEDLVACVIEMMSAHFEQDAKLEDEADRLANEEARRNPGVDISRLRALIKQKLAEQRDFPI